MTTLAQGLGYSAADSDDAIRAAISMKLGVPASELQLVRTCGCVIVVVPAPREDSTHA